MSVKALGASDNDHVIFTSDQTASDEFNKVINYLASHTFCYIQHLSEPLKV